MTHNYEESDGTSPYLDYLDECFDVGLCGKLALTRPYTHHEEGSCTNYQVNLDVPISLNQQNDSLDCNIIIAVVE